MTQEPQAHGQDGADAGLDTVVWGRCRAGTGWFWMARHTAWDGSVRRAAHGWSGNQDDAMRAGAAAARDLAAGTRAQVFLRHRAAECALQVLLEDGSAPAGREPACARLDASPAAARCPVRCRPGPPPGR
ncbi:hypothetical protein ACFY7H_22630 [Streptomyces sp. NPDC012794]|uniref:hypothetical protein n=1 Tax=Streptomyces sp. NPDC012794 TaxID=3364850 RepID=UPI0036C20DE0